MASAGFKASCSTPIRFAPLLLTLEATLSSSFLTLELDLAPTSLSSVLCSFSCQDQGPLDGGWLGLSPHSSPCLPARVVATTWAAAPWHKTPQLQASGATSMSRVTLHQHLLPCWTCQVRCWRPSMQPLDVGCLPGDWGWGVNQCVGCQRIAVAFA